MSRNRGDLNPYSILTVNRNASDQEINVAYLQKMEAAPYTPSLSVFQIEAAYGILKDPELRKGLNRKLDAQVLRTLVTEPMPGALSRSRADSRGTSRRKIALLTVLLGVLVLSSFFFVLRERGAVCPQCHHATLFQVEDSGDRSILSCTRAECDFSHVYDKKEDTDEREHEGADKAGSRNEGQDAG